MHQLRVDNQALAERCDQLLVRSTAASAADGAAPAQVSLAALLQLCSDYGYYLVVALLTLIALVALRMTRTSGGGVVE